ncbi:PREDICTED: uncharacterized protein LOC101311827 [Fragaria vesca subsp. vesca]|uniref:uncharacterized protein LOC101311827 n=1 Tax=Fragaria vesca subsp. vesca TaxID=101020 RepID=UPI0002C322A0|nr:PREDICTED: uncharacterized protein LOC101311827 [Fragaria vesca subsp. vesca]
MDLGCLDLGCIEVSDKHGATQPSPESLTASSKIGKNKSPKETSVSTLNSLNKFTSQIKKPAHRKSSPLNWFPRKKGDSYLMRKIKMLQEADGMNLTLDETLGDSNPHYSKVLREKMAAREAAQKAMQARKAALVEASWCRILQAARIQRKEAEAELLKVDKAAAEAFEVASSVGVIMYDIPNCTRKPSVETSTINGGKSTTHTVTASFETAFEVDKEVAAAVKVALVTLGNSPSFSKDEFKELLRKISENPDTGEKELTEFSSECESESGSELETVAEKDNANSQDLDCKMQGLEVRQKKSRRQSFGKLNMENIVDMILERLQCLKEEELSSLATIVATCGLNAALAENSKLLGPGSAAETFPRRMSTLGAGKPEYFLDGQIRKKEIKSELPSLDKFLVKHMTKLEKEVQEAKNRRNESKEGTAGNSDRIIDEKASSDKSQIITETVPGLGTILLKHGSKFEKEIKEAKENSRGDFGTLQKNSERNKTSYDAIPSLESVLVKHSSKLEKEVEEAKKNFVRTATVSHKKVGGVSQGRENATEVPSLDQVLVKRVSRLEKEVQEAKNRRENNTRGVRLAHLKIKNVDSYATESKEKVDSCSSEGPEEKENVDLNKNAAENMEKNANAVETNKKAGTEGAEDSLDKIMLKPVHWLEREKRKALAEGNNFEYRTLEKKKGENSITECESLDKVLVKHVSRLEKEKMKMKLGAEEPAEMKRSKAKLHSLVDEAGGLDQILVKHKSRLEREKAAAAQQPEDQTRLSVTRKQARERELQEQWGGLGLGNSMKPHQSKLELDKAAWIKAEQEEKRQAVGFSG